MIKMLDVLKEGSYDAQGVGDKAYEKFHISTDYANLKAHAQLQKELNGKPVAKIHDTYIFLNPTSLRYFGKNVRAIADNYGNLYVAQKDGHLIHHDIAKAVGIVKSNPYYEGDEYVCFVRHGNGNNLYDLSTYWDDHIHARAIKSIRARHPNFNILSDF
jgi:hypothetical protein